MSNVLNLSKDDIIVLDPKESHYEYSGYTSILKKEIGTIKQTQLSTSILDLYNWYIDKDYKLTS